jgi:hypothetical protein
METNGKKSISYYIRSLHRDIGFFVVGLTLIYGISGILLIYRETGFLKQDKQIERQLSPNIKESELGAMLHIRNFTITKTEGDVVYFQNGTYNKTSGIVHYSDKSLPGFLERLNNLHKKSSKDISHIFSTLFGASLLFLALSSFWMLQPKTKTFRRGILFAGSGLFFAIILLFLP